MQLTGGGVVIMNAGSTIGGSRLVNLNNTIQGQGAINTNLTNLGAVFATGGTLTLSQQTTNSGALKVDAGATMDASAATAKLVNFNPPTFPAGTLNGGTYNISGTFKFNNGGFNNDIVINTANLTLNGAAATIQDQAGKDALANLAQNSAGASLTFINHNFKANANFQNFAVLKQDPSTFTVGGDFTQGSTGLLDLDIASGTEFSRMLISGTATLGGVLEADFGNFTPTLGQSYQVMDYTSESGVFKLEVTGISSLTLTAEYNATNLTLVVSSVPEPGSLVLLGTGVVLCVAAIRCARKGGAGPDSRLEQRP
jgi:hypothetical protein